MPITNGNSGSGGISVPSGKVLPDGYEYRKSIIGALEVWNTTVTPNVLITSQNIGEFDVNGSLRAAINTIYLEDAHSIKSSGEEVVFKNLESNVFYTPLWQFTSEDGESIGEASVLVEEPTSTDYFQNGLVPTNGTSVDCVDTYTTTDNGTVYQFITESAQNYSGKLSLELRNSLGNAVFRLDRQVNLAVSDSIVFDKLLYRVRVGNVRTFSLIKEDGNPLLVRGGLDQTKPWVRVVYRGFYDRKIVYVDSSGKIPTSDLPQIDTVERNSVANQAARLSLPVSTKFRITIQTDIQRQFYLDPNADPSVLGNWVDGGSVASAVTSVFGRSGNVTAQVGDYTATQVGAVSAPVNDGARRVLIGNVPTQEIIVDDLTTDSATVPLSAAQGKILQDTKQDTIIGDVKDSFQANDHMGWILLNGRAKVGLTPAQQAAATMLSWGDNIPDHSGRVSVGSGVTYQLGSIGGSNVILRENLPIFGLDYSGSTSESGDHTHNVPTKTVSTTDTTVSISTLYGYSADGVSGSGSTNSSDVVWYNGDGRVNTGNGKTPTSSPHNHSITIPQATTDNPSSNHNHTYSGTTQTMNGGDVQQDHMVPYMALNKFVYLGY